MSLVPVPQNEEFRLNHGDIGHVPGKLGGQVIRRSKRIYKGCYDFAVQGGAVGSVNLYDPIHGQKQALVLPPSLVISKVLIDVLTAPLSGGAATLALSSGQSPADLLAALAKASFTGLIDGIPNGAAANMIKIPAASVLGSTVSLAIAVAALTAGKFNVHIEGYLSDAQ